MKNKLIFSLSALLASAAISGAATIHWNAGSKAVFFNGEKITDGNGTGYLVYLGNTGEGTYSQDMWDFDPVTGVINNPILDQTSSGTKGLGIGKIIDSFSTAGRPGATFTDPTKGWEGGDSSQAGQEMPLPGVTPEHQICSQDIFGLYVTYLDSNGVLWTTISDIPYYMTKITGDIRDDINSCTFAINQEKAADGKLTVGGGWATAAAIPEPTTAVMALAGFAILLRRRR